MPTTILPNLVRGLVLAPQRVTIYGPSGVGKSTIAQGAPAPIYLDAEGGTNHLDITRFPRPTTWDEVEGALHYLEREAHPFRTLVLDTADWLEKLLIERICQDARKESIEEFGYGKGWTVVQERWAAFLSRLDRLRGRGLHIIVLAHACVKKFEQPEAGGSFDRYELKLSKGSSALLKEWSDAVLFANFYTRVVENDGKKRAVGGKERIFYTTHSAAHDAKNRHGLPETVPMEWASIAAIFPEPSAAPAPASSGAPSQSAPAAATSSVPTAATEPVLTGPATAEQVAKIELYWKTLRKPAQDMTKVFAWLGADALPGAERWSELTAAQAARLISFLQKKLNEICPATSAAIEAAGRAAQPA